MEKIPKTFPTTKQPNRLLSLPAPTEHQINICRKNRKLRGKNRTKRKIRVRNKKLRLVQTRMDKMGFKTWNNMGKC